LGKTHHAIRFFVIAWVTLIYSVQWQVVHPTWGGAVAWGSGFVMALLLFASVLLHELGHSLVARLQGLRVRSITLFFFGGVATIEQEPKTPGHAFQVAIAGPMVSLCLFLLLISLNRLMPDPNTPWFVISRNLASLNLVLALFNLIPGLPLDGGQVLKAIVWKLTGSQFRGIRSAARMGRLIGILAIVWGIAGAFNLSSTLGIPRGGGLWTALIGFFVWQNASTYDRMTDLQEALLKIKAEEAMTREFRVIDASLSLRQFAEQYLIGENQIPVYFAASDGRYRGIVHPETLKTIDRSEWDTRTLLSIVQPLKEGPSVQQATVLADVIQLLESHTLRRMTVLSPADAVAGVLDRGDIVRAIAKQMKLPLPETVIQQIKEEGIYPPGLPLAAIAQSAAEMR
jgi:Zn-dependent protease